VRILSADPALPYAKPPLSKAYLCGRDAKLDLHSAGWFVRHNVELQRGITVDRIDVERQEVVTEGGRHYPYWHLVLACGANPVPLRVPGGGAALTLRSFADAVILRMAARTADSAVVIGGGLIGCEAAACLASRGVPTTMVAAEPVPLQRRFGDQVGERVAKILSDSGVRFLGSTTVSDIDDTHVHLDTGATVDGDVVVSATGVRPDPHLAAMAGLDTRDDRIVVDEHMHSSARNVYAAGDVALAYNVTAGRAGRRAVRGRPAGGMGQGARILVHHRRIDLEIPRVGGLRAQPTSRAPQWLHRVVRVRRSGSRCAQPQRRRRLPIRRQAAQVAGCRSVLIRRDRREW
jgi:NAD(P)H-nitrite reductase large subunit